MLLLHGATPDEDDDELEDDDDDADESDDDEDEDGEEDEEVWQVASQNVGCLTLSGDVPILAALSTPSGR
jgi:hypothetical protein